MIAHGLCDKKGLDGEAARRLPDRLSVLKFSKVSFQGEVIGKAWPPARVDPWGVDSQEEDETCEEASKEGALMELTRG